MQHTQPLVFRADNAGEMAQSGSRYTIEWHQMAEAEIDDMRAFDARPILIAIDELRSSAEMETRNRKPLREPIPELAGASWEIRVREHRVLYQVRDGRTVRILRVILKGRRTIREALGKTS